MKDTGSPAVIEAGGVDLVCQTGDGDLKTG